MPNREAVIKTLTQDVIGNQSWDGQRRKPRKMPADDYWDTKDAMAAILERIVHVVNWDRLLSEASSRHLRLHPDKPQDVSYWTYSEGVCGECIAEALLNDDTGAPNWEQHPTSPRKFQATDWPAVVAENITHRAVARDVPIQDEARH